MGNCLQTMLNHKFNQSLEEYNTGINTINTKIADAEKELTKFELQKKELRSRVKRAPTQEQKAQALMLMEQIKSHTQLLHDLRLSKANLEKNRNSIRSSQVHHEQQQINGKALKPLKGTGINTSQMIKDMDEHNDMVNDIEENNLEIRDQLAQNSGLDFANIEDSQQEELDAFFAEDVRSSMDDAPSLSKRGNNTYTLGTEDEPENEEDAAFAACIENESSASSSSSSALTPLHVNSNNNNNHNNNNNNKRGPTAGAAELQLASVPSRSSTTKLEPRILADLT